MSIKIVQGVFDPWREVIDFQASMPTPLNQCGATSVFVGTMRDFNDGDRVNSMTLEHYPAMTQKQLEKIGADAKQKYAINELLIVHRVGIILPSDAIVLVAVWSAHRAAAFDACREVMEELKSSAPFWKKEDTDGGSKWVAHNTPRSN